MKKVIFTTAILAALLVSCNEKQEKQEKHEAVEASEVVHEHEETDLKTSYSFNNNWVNEIALDNGAKWVANLETNEGVDKMLGMIKQSDPKTVEDYHDLAAKLNEEKNYVVKECTMTGPSHDNLHVFLHPLIEKIEALGKISSTDEGTEVIASIKENLNGYYNYFN